MHYPEKKGYSARSLTYMCQFARTYPLEILQRMLSCDKVLRTPTIPNMLSLTDELNCLPITQEPLAQFQTNIFQSKEFTQEPLAQIQKIDKTISAMLQTSIDDIEKDIIDRDYRDMHRETSPLKQAEDAVLVDTSDMTIEQVIDRIVALIG